MIVWAVKLSDFAGLYPGAPRIRIAILVAVVAIHGCAAAVYYARRRQRR